MADRALKLWPPSFRRVPKEESRLERVDEVLDDEILDRGVDGLVSTNAIQPLLRPARGRALVARRPACGRADPPSVGQHPPSPGSGRRVDHRHVLDVPDVRPSGLSESEVLIHRVIARHRSHPYLQGRHAGASGRLPGRRARAHPHLSRPRLRRGLLQRSCHRPLPAHRAPHGSPLQPRRGSDGEPEARALRGAQDRPTGEVRGRSPGPGAGALRGDRGVGSWSAPTRRSSPGGSWTPSRRPPGATPGRR